MRGLFCLLLVISMEQALFAAVENQWGLRLENYYPHVTAPSLMNPNNDILKLNNFHDESRLRLKTTARLSPYFEYFSHFFLAYNYFGYQQTSTGEVVSLRANELYLSSKLAPLLTLELGNKIQPLGAGFVFNPTNVSNYSTDIRNLTEDIRGTTVVAVKLDRFPETWSLICLPKIDAADKESPPRWELFRNDNAQDTYIIKYASELEEADFDVRAVLRGEPGPLYGINYARNLTGSLEFHFEGAMSVGSTMQYPKLVSPATAETPARYGFSQSKDDQTLKFFQYVLGLQYNLGNNTSFLGEYYRNETGYNPAESALFNDGLRTSADKDNYKNPVYGPPGNNIYELFLAQANQFSKIGQMGQNYLVLGLHKEKHLNNFDISLNSLTNIDDGSNYLSASVDYHGIQSLELILEGGKAFGAEDTEFGRLTIGSFVRVKTEIYF